MADQDHREERLELATGAVRVLRGGSGEPLVVLHHSTGNPGWIPFYAELARSFAVTVPDLPGYGGSERPEWAREPRDLAVILCRVLERLGLSDLTLVGLGFGGFVAAELATLQPERLRSLVLIGAAGLKPDEGEIADQMLMGHRAYVRLGFRDDAAHDAVFGAEPDAELQGVWDFSREMTARISWKPYMFSRRLPPLLLDVDVPSLLIWGDLDRVVPPVCGEQYARLLPSATLECVADAGHLVELEEPEGVAERIVAHHRKVLARAG